MHIARPTALPTTLSLATVALSACILNPGGNGGATVDTETDVASAGPTEDTTPTEQGCVVCEDSPLCHNVILTDPDTGQDACFCQAGYGWSDPGDADNLQCEPVEGRDGECDQPNSIAIDSDCYCIDGYDWCSEDPADLTCCEAPSQGTRGDTDSDTDDTSTTDPQHEPPPAEDCTEDGLRACSNDDPEELAGSVAWYCLGGEWLELDMDEDCQFDGLDFGYGCFDDGSNVIIECGFGSGAPCSDEQACSDPGTLEICIWAKLSEFSCQDVCGDASARVTYEFGECLEPGFCQCCDFPVDGACDCGGASECEE